MSSSDRYSCDSDSASASQNDSDVDNIKQSLLSQITGIKHAGSFATSYSLSEFVLPGIIVDGVGPVLVPLSSESLQALVKVSRLAPFGKKNQTIVDEKVRKTWEIDGSKVSFGNPSWDEWLSTIVEQAAHELGVAGEKNDVEARLYKMLLYKEGAMFKPHQDTERSDDMFGTLVICLPSEHHGGLVRLRHGNKEKSFATANSSAFGITYIAWYSDVAHEIEPIESGCRWVLTYNLSLKKRSNPQSAAELLTKVKHFQEELNNWQKLQRASFFAYALEHQYTNAALKMDNLKGRDYARGRFIANACADCDEFCVLLANIEKSVTLLDDDEGTEEESLGLTRIVDLEGFRLNTIELYISEDRILQSLYGGDRDPDKQWGGEHLGNQHADVERLYKNSAILIVKVSHVTNVLLGADHSSSHFRAFLEHLRDLSNENLCSTNVLDMIKQTCAWHLQTGYHPPSHGQGYGQVNDKKDCFTAQILLAATWLDDTALFSKAVKQIEEDVPLNIFFELGSTLDLNGSSINRSDLNETLTKSKGLYLFWIRLAEFIRGQKSLSNYIDPGREEQIDQWALDMLSKRMRTVSRVSPQSAGALIQIGALYPKIRQEIKAFVIKFSSTDVFMNAMATETLSILHPTYRSGDESFTNSAKAVASDTLSLVMGKAAQHFKLSVFLSTKKHEMEYPFSAASSLEQNGKRNLSREQHDAYLIADLFNWSNNHEMSESFLESLESQAQSIDVFELKRIAFHLLEQMIPHLQPGSVTASRFCNRMLETYATRVVGMEPAKPRDWIRSAEFRTPSDSKHKSECADCDSVKEFLADPHAEMKSFPKDVYQHTQYNLTWGQFSWTEQKEGFVLHKTTRAWEAQHEEWQKRAQAAQELFRELCQDKLRALLGEQFDSAMDLLVVRVNVQDEQPKKRKRQ